MRHVLVLSAALVIASPVAAFAQSAGAEARGMDGGAVHTADSPLSQLDRAFVRSVMTGSRFEQQAAQLALTRVPDGEPVQHLARRVDQDHATMAERLLAIAPPQPDAPPDGLTKQQRTQLDRLARLSGDAFAAAYIRGRIADHEHDVAAFERQAREGDSEALRRFAEETLPTLREHLELARDLQHGMPVAEAGMGPPARKPALKPQ